MNQTSTLSRSGPDLSVLLIDDDVEVGELIREFFTPRGIRIKTVHDGQRGLAEALEGAYDLVLLDVMLPGLDGFELLRQVRRRSLVPIIILTAKTARADRIAGLDAGADDYLSKPFEPDELIARVAPCFAALVGSLPRRIKCWRSMASKWRLVRARLGPREPRWI